MILHDISINHTEIVDVGHSGITFSNRTITVNGIVVKFDGKGYTDHISGYMHLDRRQAKKLIKELEEQLLIRTSKGHIAWDKRKRNNSKK